MEKGEDGQRLSAKRRLLSDQLNIAKSHLEALKVKYDLVDEHSKRISDAVNKKFSDLRLYLHEKEKAVISRIFDDVSRVKNELKASKKSAELIIHKSEQVRIIFFLLCSSRYNSTIPVTS